MKKNIYLFLTIVAMGLLHCGEAIAQATSMRLTFMDGTAPVELEHFLEGSSIGYADNGKTLVLTVNGKSVNYDVNNIQKMEFFSGTPSVALNAIEDPKTPGSFYSTFYSSLEAYSLPDGVKAYKGTVDENMKMKMIEIKDGVLPAGEPAILHSAGSTFNMSVTTFAESEATDNQLSGVDVATEQDGNTSFYGLVADDILKFSKMDTSTLIAANTAYYKSTDAQAPDAYPLIVEDIITDITAVTALPHNENAIYGITGVRQDRLMKGINIVNGKKILR